MKKKQEYIEIEITKSMISALVCVVFILVAVLVWNHSHGFSFRHYQEDHIEIISIGAFLLSLLIIPISFLFSLMKAIKEFPKTKAPLIIISLLYACFASFLFQVLI